MTEMKKHEVAGRENTKRACNGEENRASRRSAAAERCGFTTGSCAAAAAAAASHMLMTGEIVTEAAVRTPAGLLYRAMILQPQIDTEGKESGKRVSCRCAVIKDGGDDPDITTGTLIEAEVSRSDIQGIVIQGGTGIGRVTKPGLDQPVGEAAINSVPRQMIARSAGEILEKWRSQAADTANPAPAGLRVVISAPQGEALAAKTFNPRLGIVGGISILGTTGIVEPMSSRAVVETIRVQMRVLKAEGRRSVILAPGNYGLRFLHERYGLEPDRPVQISNFVAEAVEIASALGFEKILLAGHIGKLVKVAGGVRNTHSQYGDRRIEILWDIASHYCEPAEAASLQGELAQCVMTDAALDLLAKYGIREQTAEEMARRICGFLSKWSGERVQAETIVFSHQNRELVKSKGAAAMLEEGRNL